MYRVTLDLWQDDCPLARASADHEVTFTTPYWNYSPEFQQWELWVEFSSDDQSELEAGIRALRDTEAMEHFGLKRKHDSHATLQVQFDETDAIDTITAHGGAVVGPFTNCRGRERWHLGFTDPSPSTTHYPSSTIVKSSRSSNAPLAILLPSQTCTSTSMQPPHSLPRASD
ncbi:hypothetical protein [Natronococcus wangiae]